MGKQDAGSDENAGCQWQAEQPKVTAKLGGVAARSGVVSLWHSATTGKWLLSTLHSRSFACTIQAEVVEEDVKEDRVG